MATLSNILPSTLGSADDHMDMASNHDPQDDILIDYSDNEDVAVEHNPELMLNEDDLMSTNDYQELTMLDPDNIMSTNDLMENDSIPSSPATVLDINQNDAFTSADNDTTSAVYPAISTAQSPHPSSNLLHNIAEDSNSMGSHVAGTGIHSFEESHQDDSSLSHATSGALYTMHDTANQVGEDAISISAHDPLEGSKSRATRLPNEGDESVHTTNLEMSSTGHKDEFDGIDDDEEGRTHVTPDQQSFHDRDISQHPILVKYEDNTERVFLFSAADQTSSDSYFLSDPSLISQSMGTLLKACRIVLGDDITEEQELQIEAPELGLSISEESVYASSTSLSEILDVFLDLHRLDGLSVPPPLILNLIRKPSFSARLGLLRQAVSEECGFSQLLGPNTYASTFQDEHDDSGHYYIEDEHGGYADEDQAELEDAGKLHHDLHETETAEADPPDVDHVAAPAFHEETRHDSENAGHKNLEGHDDPSQSQAVTSRVAEPASEKAVEIGEPYHTLHGENSLEAADEGLNASRPSITGTIAEVSSQSQDHDQTRKREHQPLNAEGSDATIDTVISGHKVDLVGPANQTEPDFLIDFADDDGDDEVEGIPSGSVIQVKQQIAADHEQFNSPEVDYASNPINGADTLEFRTLEANSVGSNHAAEDLLDYADDPVASDEGANAAQAHADFALDIPGEQAREGRGEHVPSTASAVPSEKMSHSPREGRDLPATVVSSNDSGPYRQDTHAGEIQEQQPGAATASGGGLTGMVADGRDADQRKHETIEEGKIASAREEDQIDGHQVSPYFDEIDYSDDDEDLPFKPSPVAQEGKPGTGTSNHSTSENTNKRNLDEHLEGDISEPIDSLTKRPRSS